MNARIEEMKKEIERRGGVVQLTPEMPDELAELFLSEILNCPDCMSEAKRLAGRAKKGKRGGH